MCNFYTNHELFTLNNQNYGQAHVPAHKIQQCNLIHYGVGGGGGGVGEGYLKINVGRAVESNLNQ